MSENLNSIPVKEFVFRGIKLEVRCRNCGRTRVIQGGLLPRSFPPDMTLHQPQIDTFAKRFRCSECGARDAKARLVVEKD